MPRATKEKPKEQEPQWVTAGDIPRKKNSNGTWGGPYVLPIGAQHIPGRKKCETCGRMVKTDRKHPRKGSCQCMYYKRTTTFIDVMQDEYLLKLWGKRNVAWGMAQRPDLVLHATTCKPDSDKLNQTLEDKQELNKIAAEADSTAQSMKGATIGTSLHKLTHQMDRGETLGFVPEPYPQDLKAYNECVKTEGVEWVSIESFRVFDGWVRQHEGTHWGCGCIGVGGTVDRIGWYKGRLRIFDIKTGSDYNKLGHAMQLAMYAHMVPYLFPGDERTQDVDEIDLDVGYIIKLPEGQGHCELVPMNIQRGWAACLIAKQIWEARSWSVEIERDRRGEVTEMAGRAGTLKECRLLWENAKEMGLLDNRLKTVILRRVDELKDQGVS